MSAHRKSGPAVLGPPQNWKEPKHLSQGWDSDDTRRYDEYAMTHRLLAEEQQREADRVAGEALREQQCKCDGASYYTPKANAARSPFLRHPNCPVHGTRTTGGGS